MRLEGSAATAFEKWYKAKHKKTFSLNYLQMIIKFFGNGNNAHLKAFNCSPDEQKYGVIVDWGDSVQMHMYIKLTPANGFSVYVGRDGRHLFPEYCVTYTRPEARTAAVQKLSELYNNQER